MSTTLCACHHKYHKSIDVPCPFVLAASREGRIGKLHEQHRVLLDMFVVFALWMNWSITGGRYTQDKVAIYAHTWPK